jgi:hypothetical protein
MLPPDAESAGHARDEGGARIKQGEASTPDAARARRGGRKLCALSFVWSEAQTQHWQSNVALRWVIADARPNQGVLSTITLIDGVSATPIDGRR